MSVNIDELNPQGIVVELDKYIVGQKEAKKSVSIALRNRIRRMKLSEDMQRDVMPKNILMAGPTGVGKTEIARRLAQLSGAPFVKIEVTRYTEVGYVGKSVDSIIRDLVEESINTVKSEMAVTVETDAKNAVEERILDSLVPESVKKQGSGGIMSFFQNPQPQVSPETHRVALSKRDEMRQKLKNGELEDTQIEIEIEDNTPVMPMIGGMSPEDLGIDLQDMFGGMMPKKMKRKSVKVKDARRLLLPVESEKLIDKDRMIQEALERAQYKGIVFLDEFDKIVGTNSKSGPDVSREGVQRDLLPIVEGTTISTKYGPVKTDYILFIAAGAFHMAKPSDLIPEIQGRFPIRVELEPLTQQDFERILVEPKNSLIKQYSALLATEGVDVEFTPDGISEMARIAYEVNSKNENIGARRLYTVMEKVMEDVSFKAPDIEKTISIDKDYVFQRVGEIVKNEDLSSYIL
uniref:ATP-dependent protease ATPase subunit HslU n=1 Tax=Mesoaciditoga lauensis TaxID=1495039 RepID=A0A7V3RDB2_9BACT